MTRALLSDWFGTLAALTLFVCAVFFCLALNTLNHSLQSEVQYLRLELQEVSHQRDLSAIDAIKSNNNVVIPDHEPEASGQEVEP